MQQLLERPGLHTCFRNLRQAHKDHKNQNPQHISSLPWRLNFVARSALGQLCGKTICLLFVQKLWSWTSGHPSCHINAATGPKMGHVTTLSIYRSSFMIILLSLLSARDPWRYHQGCHPHLLHAYLPYWPSSWQCWAPPWRWQSWHGLTWCKFKSSDFLGLRLRTNWLDKIIYVPGENNVSSVELRRKSMEASSHLRF